MATLTGLTIIHCLRAPVGGAFRHVLDLALAQTAAGHRVGIVCDALTGGAFEAARIAEVAPRLAFGIHRVPMRRALSPSDMLVSLGLYRYIARLKPDILHGHGAKGGAYARLIGTALRLKGQAPLRIYCPHGGSLHYDATSLKGRIFFALERLLQRLGDGIVFVSDHEARLFAQKVGIPATPTTRAWNGLAPAEFEPVAPRMDAAEFLFVGTLRQLKGVDVLIAALAALRDGGEPATALIVGDGEDEAALRAEVTRLRLQDLVSFAPPMPIREAMALGRVMVMPSRAESLPYVVLETAAAHMPLIATHVGGIPEIFGPETPRLIEPGSVAALAAALRQTRTDRAGLAASTDRLQRRVQDAFSIAAMTGAIEAFYSRLLDARRTAHASPAPAHIAPSSEQTNPRAGRS